MFFVADDDDDYDQIDRKKDNNKINFLKNAQFLFCNFFKINSFVKKMNESSFTRCNLHLICKTAKQTLT